MGSPERTRGFIPLPEVHEQTDHIRFNLDLPPWIPQEEISIHIRRIHALMQIGGIGKLDITPMSLEQETQMPTVVGVDASGSAIGGRVSSKTSSAMFITTHLETDHPSAKCIPERWRRSIILIDTERVAREVESKFPGKLRLPHPWARTLNSIVRRGILEEGHCHLLHDPGWLERVLAGITLYNYSKPLLDGNLTLFMIFFALSQSLVMLPRGINMSHGDFKPHGPCHNFFRDEFFRYSIFAFWGPQFDRLALLNLLARLPNRPLVKSLAQEK